MPRVSEGQQWEAQTLGMPQCWALPLPFTGISTPSPNSLFYPHPTLELGEPSMRKNPRWPWLPFSWTLPAALRFQSYRHKITFPLLIPQFQTHSWPWGWPPYPWSVPVRATCPFLPSLATSIPLALPHPPTPSPTLLHPPTPSLTLPRPPASSVPTERPSTPKTAPVLRQSMAVWLSGEHGILAPTLSCQPGPRARWAWAPAGSRRTRPQPPLWQEPTPSSSTSSSRPGTDRRNTMSTKRQARCLTSAPQRLTSRHRASGPQGPPTLMHNACPSSSTPRVPRTDPHTHTHTHAKTGQRVFPAASLGTTGAKEPGDVVPPPRKGSHTCTRAVEHHRPNL